MNKDPVSEERAAAELLLARAAEQERAGDWPAAAGTLQEVLGRWPGLADTWYNLARMQRRCGEPEAALASYARALELGLDGPEEAHLNRGVIYADDLQCAELAETELQRALALNPNYLPAWLNLANLHEDRGEREAARLAYERALALQPDHPEALARLANASIIERTDDPLISRLRAALAALAVCIGLGACATTKPDFVIPPATTDDPLAQAKANASKRQR